MNMRHIFLTLFSCFVINGIFGQEVNVVEPSLKYGKPSAEELSMTTYAPDTTATAVVLCKKTDVSYDFVTEDFRLEYAYEVKIKILKADGTSYANVTIPYYNSKDNYKSKEIVSQIEASSYNLEGGKTERTKMKKDFIFMERINDTYMQVKFSIPNVKVGTVIEYKYKILSDFYYTLNDWYAQQDIPTLYTEYNITIPEYFKFNIDMRGTEPLETKDEGKLFNFHSNGHPLQCSGRHLCFKGRQLPAVRNDNYIWCVDDYSTQVNFELGGLDFPGALYKSFTQTWENIDKLLLDNQDFGGRLKMRNPYHEEMASLKLDQMASTEDKIASIFTFLKQRVKWDETYSLEGSRAKKIVKDGTASNAEINFIFMSMLRDAGIESFPVVMSRRNRGLIPYAHPSLQKLNTFIVAIANTDSTFVYLDGSVRDGYINVLPPALMVNRARLIMPGIGAKWVDLSQIGKNQLRSMVSAIIQPDGKICGTRTTNYRGQYASRFRHSFRSAKDSTEFVNQLASNEEIEVTGLQTDGINEFSPNAKEIVKFEKQATVNDDFIYLNPMVFLHVEKNPFTQSERKLPVEFPYPDQVILSVNLTIPDGYTVEEMPTPLQIKTEDGQGTCRYNLAMQANKLTINYMFNFNKLLYLSTEYPGLQSFWEMVANKNNETIVLKKL